MKSSELTHRRYRARKSAIFRRDRFLCTVCGAPATEIDHRIPRMLGGKVHDPANLRAICSDCNKSKGGRLLTDAEVRERRGLPPLPVRVGGGLGPLLIRGPRQ